ncbi:hypothetical protein F5882DRAFT_422580 [Hyaloscypha sp. PMI_1271]|nr:hypothetical protein F5882DRAFT_422580 [Hyaloscypha sp. PMI_1271]
MGYSPQLRGHWFEQKRNMTTDFWQQLMDTSLIHSHELEDQWHDRGIEGLPGFETPLYKRFCDLPLLHNNRRMFSYKLKDSTRDLDDGYGLGGDRLEPGDTICVILGCSTPVVLRQKEEHYLLVADAVTPGFMSGEAVQGDHV